MKLKGKVAVVTGAGRGLGRAISLAFAREGAEVAVTSNVEDENRAVADEIAGMGAKARPFFLDVTDEAEVREVAAATLAEFGRIDILVSNAGISKRGLLLFSESEEWKKTIEVMVYGTYYCCKAFVPSMVERNWGRVIVMSSIMGKRANTANSSYAVAKHGLIGLTRTLAAELAMAGAKGVTVNAICPGIANTDMVTGPEGTIAALSQLLNITPEQVWNQFMQKMSLQERLIEPEEIAGMAVYLASEDARGITAQAINVCGGSELH